MQACIQFIYKENKSIVQDINPWAGQGKKFKTVRVNNFNKLHIIVLAVHIEKSGGYNAEQGGIFKPALLCRDYLILSISKKDHNRLNN